VWDQTPPMLVKTEQDVEEAYKKRLDAQRHLEKNKEKIRQAVISIQRDRYAQVESYFDQLPDNVRATLQKAYAEKHFINSQDIVTKLFHRNGWTGIPKHMIVMDYKANNERGIFTLSEQEEIEIYVQKQSLMDVYTSMQKEGEI
jgi:glucan phosphorylase